MCSGDVWAHLILLKAEDDLNVTARTTVSGNTNVGNGIKMTSIVDRLGITAGDFFVHKCIFCSTNRPAILTAEVATNS